jgi:hypothetical protein
MSWSEAQEIIDELTEQIGDKVLTGIPPQDMAAFSPAAGDGTIKLKFTEPADTFIDNQRVCSVKGVKIVMKQGGYPVDETDGTLIIDNTDIGAYSDTALEITGLNNDEDYYLCAFPYSDSGLYNRAAGLRIWNNDYAVKNRAKVTPKAYILYGYKKAKNDSAPGARVEALEMSVGLTPAKMDFTAGEFNYGGYANAFFMPKPYMVKSSGQLDYELDHSDQAKKLDGTASDISNTAYDGNAMSIFPTVWQYKYEDDNYEYRYFCNIQLNENYKADMWTREDGTVEEWQGIGMFEGSYINSKMRSLAGQTVGVSQTAQTELNYAAANGEHYTTNAWCEWDTICGLLVLMSLNTNAQEVYGYGRGGASAASATGELKNKGMFFGYSQSQSTTNAVKVFYLENWWGNVWNRIQGCIAINRSIRIKMTKPYNLTGTDFINTGLTLTGTSGGYINKTKTDNSYGTVPYEASGSETTYECDGLWYNTSAGTYVALVGGSWGNAALLGFFCLNLNFAASSTSTGIGARLSCEQPAA